MNDEEKKCVKKANVDIAMNRTTLPIILIAISLATYLIPLAFGEFDFGIVFEIVSLVFLLLAKSDMSVYDEDKAKLYIIISMLPIGWILVYDLIFFFASIQDVTDLIFFGYDYYVSELLLIFYFIGLFNIYKCLAKADNPEKYKESTDWFYENYEEKDKEKNDV